ncbi:MAG: ATPase, T2SS/T4P/T4SS family, partial [Phycisphaerae bacterium]
NLSKDGVRDQIATVTDRFVQEAGIPMTTVEKDRLIEEVLDEVFGLGPLEPLMNDPSVSDIMVNGYDSVYVERAGQLVETPVRFKDQAHVRMTIARSVSNIGRRIEDRSPSVDAR